MECRIIAVNGTQDHIHVLAQLGPQVAAARLINQFKGVSSRYINENSPTEAPATFTGWQRGYGAYSIASNQVKIVAKYIARQKERHTNNQIWASLEPADSTA